MIPADNEHYGRTNSIDNGDPTITLLPDQQPGTQQETQIIIPQPVFVFKPRTTGFEKLQSMQGIFIKQKLFNKWTALCACDRRNRYFIYGLNDDNEKDKKGSKIFKCYEKSSCFQKKLCPPCMRTFNMEVKHKDYQDQNFNDSNFLLFEREFKCICFCLGRPVLKVHSTENGTADYLGKVVNLCFKCSDLSFEIRDNQDLMRYKIFGSCCQCGVLCQGPCYQYAKLDIEDYQGNICGSIKRIPTASYVVKFPPQSTPREKALFIGVTIMIDFAYFDCSGNVD